MNEFMEKDAKIKKDLLSRLKRIEGQVRGVQKMIEDNRDCGEIVIQLSAIKAAVNRVGFSVLACYLAGNMQEGLEKNEDLSKQMKDFMEVLKKFS